MAMRLKLSLTVFLFFFLLALFSNLSFARKETEVEDPELKTCKHQCQQQQQYTEKDKRKCLQACDEYHRMKQEREEQREDEGDEGQEQHEENPFVFEHDDFEAEIETDGGRIRVLEKFTEKSKLLRGILNYRLATLEAKAHTFVSPRHFDSDVVLFVIKGQAVLGLVREGETEKVMIDCGDMMTITAGTPLYMVNTDANEKLYIAMLHIPVSTPGKFEEFFGPGGRDPESVLSAFSGHVLQAALQSPRGKLEKLFDQQNDGSIFKITSKQVSALAPKKSSWWPFGGPSKAPLNIFTKNPSFSNKYGRLTEILPEDDKSGLQRLNLMLTFTNITQRSMSTIMYNTHAMKIALVIDGSGKVEIAKPVESKHEKGSSTSYHRISAPLKPGMVFVVPPAHPFVTVASNKENLLLICFEINARHNKKFTFAGKNNIVISLDNNAKAIGFNNPADIVNGIFDRKESWFFPFELPIEEEEQGGRHADA